MPKFRSQLWEIPHRENCFTVSITRKERRRQWCNNEEVWKKNLIIFLHTNTTVIYTQLCKLSHYYPKYLNTDNSDVPTKGVTQQSWLPMSTCTTLWASQIRSVVSFKIHRDFSLLLMWCCESPVTTLTGSNNKKNTSHDPVMHCTDAQLCYSWAPEALGNAIFKRSFTQVLTKVNRALQKSNETFHPKLHERVNLEEEG